MTALRDNPDAPDATQSAAAPAGSNLTDPGYWSRRQGALRRSGLDATAMEMLDAVQPHLEPYRGGSFLELGCSPGVISATLGARFDFTLSGVDTAPTADIYVKNVRDITGRNATLYREDALRFDPGFRFDVVASFGLVEHFTDTRDVLDAHVRLCRPGGLVVICIPNFRKLQGAYHALVDAADLRLHNTSIMHPDHFSAFAARAGLSILQCGYAGTIAFWNVDREGSRAAVALRLAVSAAFRIAARALRPVLPSGRACCAPWIVFAGRKP